MGGMTDQKINFGQNKKLVGFMIAFEEYKRYMYDVCDKV